MLSMAAIQKHMIPDIFTLDSHTCSNSLLLCLHPPGGKFTMSLSLEKSYSWFSVARVSNKPDSLCLIGPSMDTPSQIKLR